MNSKCDTCLRICDITNSMCRACHDGSNWIEGPRREAPAAQTARSCDTCSYLVGKCPPCDDGLSGYVPSAVFDEERIDIVGSNGNDGAHYGESRLNAFGLPYAQAAMNVLYRDMLDNMDVAPGPERKVKSDGSTARYYEIPDGATELQDLISFKNMNSQIGEIFRACYRYGEVEHSDKLRDAKKVKFYAEAEIARLEKYEVRGTRYKMTDIVIKELKEQLAAAQAREKVLMVAIESLVENVDRPPDANCSCHISPPCSDCVDYGGLREAFEWVDTALAMPTDDTTLNNLLAEGQSREKVLRDALDYLAHNLGEYACAMQTQQQADVLTNYSIAAFAALAQPSDDTALKAALKAERERCAKVCDEMFSGQIGAVHVASTRCAIAIRSLEDE